MQHQLVVFQGPPQLALHDQPLGRVGGGRRLVDDDPRGSALSLVHRGVGALEQQLHRVPVRRVQRDPEARLDAERNLLEDELGSQLLTDPGEQLRRVRSVWNAGQDQAELVAPQPRDRVVGAQGGQQPLGDDAQQLVARVVAERVVDVLEAVQVDQDDRAALAALAALDGLLRPFAEPFAVGQAGQRVVQRLVLVPGGVAAQAPGRGPRDERQHRIQRAEPGRQPHVRAAHLRLDVLGDGAVGQVELQHPGRLAGGRGDDRLQHADHLAGCAVGILDDGDVGVADRGGAEGRMCGGQGSCGGPVIGEHDPSLEAAKAQPDDRTIEDGQVGGALEPLAFRGGQLVIEIGAGQGRRDRHLLDHRGLRPTMLQPAL